MQVAGRSKSRLAPSWAAKNNFLDLCDLFFGMTCEFVSNHESLASGAMRTSSAECVRLFAQKGADKVYAALLNGLRARMNRGLVFEDLK